MRAARGGAFAGLMIFGGLTDDQSFCRSDRRAALQDAGIYSKSIA
jgi:hypothetical protein